MCMIHTAGVAERGVPLVRVSALHVLSWNNIAHRIGSLDHVKVETKLMSKAKETHNQTRVAITGSLYRFCDFH